MVMIQGGTLNVKTRIQKWSAIFGYGSSIFFKVLHV